MNLTIIQRILAELNENQFNSGTIRDKIFHQYILTSKSNITSIINRRAQPTMYLSLKNYLGENWRLINNSLLCYSAIPNEKISQLFFHIANYVAEYHNLNRVDIQKPITPLEVLMPGVNLESEHKDFPSFCATLDPKWSDVDERNLKELRKLSDSLKAKYLNLGEEIDGISELSDDEQNIINEIDELNYRLQHAKILKNDNLITNTEQKLEDHIQNLTLPLRIKLNFRNAFRELNVLELQKAEKVRALELVTSKKYFTKGSYLIPKVSLTRVFNTHILNVAADALIPVAVILDDINLRPYGGSLDKDNLLIEQKKLQDHSHSTKSIFESSERLEELSRENFNLLSQLNYLCKQLRINDSHEGIGKSEYAGTGAYKAIFLFFEFYKTLSEQSLDKIPSELKNAIEFLYKITTDVKFNEENSSKDHGLCIGVRREKLEMLIARYTMEIASIDCPDENKHNLMRSLKDKIDSKKEDLKNLLAMARYEVSSNASLTLNIVEKFKINIYINNYDDLALFMGLSAAEILNLCPKVRINIKEIFPDLDSLVEFSISFATNKIENLFKYIGGRIYTLFEDDEQILNFLDMMPEGKFKFYAEFFINVDNDITTIIYRNFIDKTQFLLKNKTALLILFKENILETIPEDFINDSDIMSVALHSNPLFLKDAPHNFTNDKNLLREILAINGAAYFYISEELKTNKELALIALKAADNLYNKLDKSLKNDIDIGFAVVKRNALSYSCLHIALKHHMKIALYVIKETPYAYQLLPEELRENSSILKELLKHPSGYKELAYAPYSVTNDFDTMFNLIAQDVKAYEYASFVIKSNKTLALRVIEKDYHLFDYASRELKGNKEFVLTILNKNGSLLHYVSNYLKNDFDCVLTAVQNYGLALTYASPALLQNYLIVNAAIEQDPRALLMSNLMHDKTLSLKAVHLLPRLYFSLPTNIKKQQDLFYTALKYYYKFNSASYLDAFNDNNIPKEVMYHIHHIYKVKLSLERELEHQHSFFLKRYNLTTKEKIDAIESFILTIMLGGVIEKSKLITVNTTLASCDFQALGKKIKFRDYITIVEQIVEKPAEVESSAPTV